MITKKMGLEQSTACFHLYSS